MNTRYMGKGEQSTLENYLTVKRCTTLDCPMSKKNRVTAATSQGDAKWGTGFPTRVTDRNVRAHVFWTRYSFYGPSPKSGRPTPFTGLARCGKIAVPSDSITTSSGNLGALGKAISSARIHETHSIEVTRTNVSNPSVRIRILFIALTLHSQKLRYRLTFNSGVICQIKGPSPM